jgi:hypothetical protein
MMQLQDQERTKVLLVTLPETTPVLEAANLQSDLERAGIHPWGWIINNSLSIAQTQSPLLCQRALQTSSNRGCEKPACKPHSVSTGNGCRAHWHRETQRAGCLIFCIYRAAKPSCLEDLCYWQALFLS